MTFLQKIEKNSTLIFLIFCLLLFLNIVGTCSTIKKINNTTDNINKSIDILQKLQQNVNIKQEIILEKKFLEFIITEQQLHDKKIEISDLNIKLENSLNKLKKLQDSIKN